MRQRVVLSLALAALVLTTCGMSLDRDLYHPPPIQKSQLPMLLEFGSGHLFLFTNTNGRLRISAFGPADKFYHPRDLIIRPVDRHSIEIQQTEPQRRPHER